MSKRKVDITKCAVTSLVESEETIHKISERKIDYILRELRTLKRMLNDPIGYEAEVDEDAIELVCGIEKELLIFKVNQGEKYE